MYYTVHVKDTHGSSHRNNAVSSSNLFTSTTETLLLLQKLWRNIQTIYETLFVILSSSESDVDCAANRKQWGERLA